MGMPDKNDNLIGYKVIDEFWFRKNTAAVIKGNPCTAVFGLYFWKTSIQA